MPISKKTVRKAKEDLREGKKPTTAAGEFVQEEFEHLKKGKHGAASRQQVVAIGLSKARRAGIPVPVRGKGQMSQARQPSSRRQSRQRVGRAAHR
ncbi:MAG TPA: hypothetical protein VN972_01110 [Methylomirabilota bacterium]|nr:hypothetical protein [Methylomirabilota bacterium]